MPHESSLPLPLPLPSKPRPAARLLSVLLRLAILHAVLALFFLFAGLAALSLLLLCLSGKFLRIRIRIRRRRIRPPPPPSRGLPRDEMRRLPAFRCPSPLDDDCAVCLEGLGEGQWCRALPGCGHLFHRVCVDRWLERSGACPICRRRI